MAWQTEEQITEMGFACFGKNVLLSDKASFYNCKNIRLGNNVRIDDFCVLSAGEGGIDIGDYVHVAVFSSLIGKEKISIGDFCNISSRVSIYSSSDDYSGRYLTNPLVPEQYSNVIQANVMFGKHVIIGSGSVVLPGVVLASGVAVGALSLIKESIQPFTIVAGIPARKIGNRNKGLLNKEAALLACLGEKGMSNE